MIEAFCSLVEFRDIKTEFTLISYLQEVEDFKEKMKKGFPDLNLGLLKLDGEEEVGKVGDEEIHVEDLFNPAQEDHVAKDVALALPPTIIVLLDHAEVNESRAPDEA
ncbi:hypothetical protein COCNU_scaffold006198G000040 [Cocos nucifera]|nr:hypothetical protein [Cocos nucifera]